MNGFLYGEAGVLFPVSLFFVYINDYVSIIMNCIMKDNPVSCRIVFKGMVQGVGFRFTASRMARSLALGGFVKNLEDGKVEVRLEGDRKDIGSFIEGIRDSMRGHIKDMEMEWDEYGNKFLDFQIKF